MSTNTTTANAIRTVLDEALAASSDVVLLGETVGRMGGHAGTTTGLLATHGPDRVRDLPVSDRGTLGLALGLALAGKRPVVELAGTHRLLAGLEVLAEAAAIASRRDFAAPLVVRVPYGTEAGATDAPIGPALARIPGLTVVCASDAGTAAGLLRSALTAQGPVVLLEPRVAMNERSAVGTEALPFTARTLRSGDHVTIAAWGNGVEPALQAAESLASEGLSAEVLDLVALSPIDRDTLAASIQRTGRLVVVHPDDPALADAARAIGLDEAFLFLESPLARASEAPEAVARVARASITY